MLVFCGYFPDCGSRKITGLQGMEKSSRDDRKLPIKPMEVFYLPPSQTPGLAVSRPGVSPLGQWMQGVKISVPNRRYLP